MIDLFILAAYLLFIAFIAPPAILLSLLFWTLVGEAMEKVYEVLYPQELPSCDINPRCHPRFAWGSDGNGWIGNIIVIKKENA